jgi:hypothetical protein
MPFPPPAEAARDGWRAARAIGAIAERVAALPVDEATARTTLRTAAQELGLRAVMHEDADRFASMRARIAACPTCVFYDWARDAASAFGNAEAATPMFEPMAALIEGIRIVDDIQDEEPSCLATEVGVKRALMLASGAFGVALELIAALPLHGPSWRASAAALGRGLRETAAGQELETAGAADFDAFWNVVDRKTGPLVATALEVGALAAGAPPSAAAALTTISIPLGRLLQIGDDCLDALGAHASDWRAPRNNLLMLYALSGPHAAELEALLARAADPEALHAAQVALLRDGALAYAVHAQLTVLAQLEHAIDGLALPHPEAFRRYVQHQRREAEMLLTQSGVEPELAARLTGV